MNLFTCVYCSWQGPITDFEIDHIFPLSRGGLDIPQNKQFICSGCNREKSDKTHEEYVSYRFTNSLLGIQSNYGFMKGDD